MRTWLAALVVLFIATTAYAQTEATAPKDQAKLHFAVGVEKFEGGDLEGAIVAYEKAYELLPYAIIQYNIALAYEKLGEPVATIAAMEKALAGTPKINADRRARAKRTVAEQEKRVGKLSIACNVEGAEVTVNGRKAGAAPLQNVRVPAIRTLTVETRAAGYLPDSRVIQVVAGNMSEERIELVALDEPPAKIAVETVLPGVEVYVDGSRKAVTPLRGPVAVTPDESHRVELRRRGYKSKVEALKLGPGLDATITFEAELDPAASERGELTLDVSPDDATVRIDGEIQYERSLSVVPGAHVVTIERTGYDTAERTVNVTPGGAALEVSLLPTEETRQEQIADAEQTIAAGWGLTIGGAVLLGAGIGVLGFNAGLASDTADERERFDGREGQYADCSPPGMRDCTTDREDIISDEGLSTILWVVGGAGAAIGAGMAVAGVTLLATGEDPDAFRLQLDEGLDVTFLPTLDIRRDYVGTGLRGSF